MQEATLAAASRSQDVASEHAALGLFLLQVNVLVPGDYMKTHIKSVTAFRARRTGLGFGKSFTQSTATQIGMQQ